MPRSADKWHVDDAGGNAAMASSRHSAEPPNLDRFLQFIEGDDLGLVLRSHLALEVTLNAVIEADSQSSIRDVERVGFMAKVDEVTRLGGLPADARPSFVVANKIRNDFAHRLDARITEERAAEFLASFDPTQWDGFMFRAHQAAVAGSPRDRVGFCYATLFIIAASYGGLILEILASMPVRGNEPLNVGRP
jgi:hypothetical protein